MLLPLVVAGSLCAQTHVPYVVPCGVLTIGALFVATWQRPHRVVNGRRRWIDRHVVIAAALGVALWVPPLVDQLSNDPANMRTLLDHFGGPPEAVLGVADGTRLALRHLDVWAGFAGFTGDLEGAGRFVSPAANVARRGDARRVAGHGGRRVATWTIAAAALARRYRRGAAPRADLDDSHLRTALVLPHALGMGDDDPRSRRCGLDVPGDVAEAAQ